MQYSIVTSDFTRASFIVVTLCVRDDAVEAEVSHQVIRSMGTLFTVGIVGVGLVAIPTLITSAAYALAETFRWTDGLNEKFKAARPFYGVIILSSVVGIALDFADVSPMRALFGAAIVNGLLDPFLLVGILIVASDRKIMRQQPSSLLARLAVGVAALAMLGAAIGMFVS